MSLFWCAALVIAMVAPTAGQPPSYFIGPGLFTSASCLTEPCSRCGTGFFKANCTGIQPGSCAKCTTPLPANAEYTSDGGFSDSCSVGCKEAFELIGGVCAVKASSIYVVAISISLPLSAADVASKKVDIIRVFADLSSCGACGSYEPNPIICERCRILVNVTQTAARRLLAPTSILDLSLQQLDGLSQATATATALTASNINTQLASKSVPQSAVLSNAEIRVQAAPAPPPPPSPPSPPAPAPATPAPNQEAGSNTGVIIGGVAGGVVFLVGAAVVACCFMQRQASRATEPSTLSKKGAPQSTPSAASITPGTPSHAKFNSGRNRMLSKVSIDTPVKMQSRLPSAMLVMGPSYRTPFQAHPPRS